MVFNVAAESQLCHLYGLRRGSLLEAAAGTRDEQPAEIIQLANERKL